ncbi:FixH family protein [Longitalea luteola]|uniref:FixH family protein n=1 Tax=Longitalea luteola TaxID=2812563 RepID=UPI001A96661A|nr:FixH family protein [Longitalea luteola]
MTFNWGHKLTLGFLAFAGMIVYMVIQSMQTHYDLVSKEYYKDELQYQQVIDGAYRANQLSTRTSITRTNDQLIIQLPGEMQQQAVTGSILFYCADDSKKDKIIALQVNEQAIQVINSRSFIPGRYTARVKWQANGTSYYTEVPVTIQ